MARFLSSLFALACAASAQVGATAPPAAGKMTITSVHTVYKGSADFDRVRKFLLDQQRQDATGSTSVSDLAPGRLGKFTMRSVRYRPMPAQAVPDNDIPTIPTDEKRPANGDSWSVSTCAGNLFQSWTWTYGKQGWAATGREINTRSSCGD